jgi:hypothetical protein
LKGLGAAALGAAGLSRFGETNAANLGNSPCAHFCVTLYPPGPARGACISAAAQGQGECPSCGADATAANICYTPSGTVYCPDFSNDPLNCGKCANVCTTSVANASPACASETCGFQCDAGYTQCGNACVDDQTDVNNCGACGNVCPGGATCSSGACVCPAGETGCSATCCTQISTPGGACYWLDCGGNGCCWDLNGYYAGDPASCQQLDSCSPGGGGGSGGGCYKWATSSC